MRTDPNDLLDVRTGELIDPADVDRLSDFLAYLREGKRALQEGINIIQGAIVAEAERRGTKTIHLDDGRTASIGGGTEVVWDTEVLNELLEAGLPEERFNQLVTTVITYKVNANVAKSIAGANADYADIIDRARSTVEK